VAGGDVDVERVVAQVRGPAAEPGALDRALSDVEVGRVVVNGRRRVPVEVLERKLAPKGRRIGD
jgi:hypothetical protein